MKRDKGRKMQARDIREAMRRLDDARVSAGLCRHCGGKVPCSSPFGDASLGKRYPLPRDGGDQ